MRLSATLAGLVLCTMVFVSQSAKASALEPQDFIFDTPKNVSMEQVALNIVEDKFEVKKEKTPDVEVIPEKIQYTVVQNDTLTTIAEKHQTTWQRLYDKNTQIKSPNNINPGEILLIPAVDEKLAAREIQPVIANSPTPKNTVVSRVLGGAVGGNSYIPGYCTWYAKNRRPDLPNNLGNANTWLSRALSQGIPTGSTPRVGAIGQQGMHVVYVDKVNTDGTIRVTEMNYAGFNVISSRTVAASNFQYIY